MSKINRFFARFLLPPLSLILLLFAAYGVSVVICDGDATIAGCIMVLLISVCIIFISIGLFRLGRKCYRLETRCIAFSKSGFTVRDREDRWYEWDQIGGIGIIAYDETAAKVMCETEICIFIHPANSKDIKKLRKGFAYALWNLDRFVLMDYSPALADKLTSYSGLPMKDYRSSQIK